MASSTATKSRRKQSQSATSTSSSKTASRDNVPKIKGTFLRVRKKCYFRPIDIVNKIRHVVNLKQTPPPQPHPSSDSSITEQLTPQIKFAQYSYPQDKFDRDVQLFSQSLASAIPGSSPYIPTQHLSPEAILASQQQRDDIRHAVQQYLSSVLPSSSPQSAVSQTTTTTTTTSSPLSSSSLSVLSSLSSSLSSSVAASSPSSPSSPSSSSSSSTTVFEPLIYPDPFMDENLIDPILVHAYKIPDSLRHVDWSAYHSGFSIYNVLGLPPPMIWGIPCSSGHFNTFYASLRKDDTYDVFSTQTLSPMSLISQQQRLLQQCWNETQNKTWIPWFRDVALCTMIQPLHWLQSDLTFPATHMPSYSAFWTMTYKMMGAIHNRDDPLLARIEYEKQQRVLKRNERFAEREARRIQAQFVRHGSRRATVSYGADIDAFITAERELEAKNEATGKRRRAPSAAKPTTNPVDHNDSDSDDDDDYGPQRKGGKRGSSKRAKTAPSEADQIVCVRDNFSTRREWRARHMNLINGTKVNINATAAAAKEGQVSQGSQSKQSSVAVRVPIFAIEQQQQQQQQQKATVSPRRTTASVQSPHWYSISAHDTIQSHILVNSLMIQANARHSALLPQSPTSPATTSTTTTINSPSQSQPTSTTGATTYNNIDLTDPTHPLTVIYSELLFSLSKANRFSLNNPLLYEYAEDVPGTFIYPSNNNADVVILNDEDGASMHDQGDQHNTDDDLFDSDNTHPKPISSSSADSATTNTPNATTLCSIPAPCANPTNLPHRVSPFNRPGVTSAVFPANCADWLNLTCFPQNSYPHISERILQQLFEPATIQRFSITCAWLVAGIYLAEQRKRHAYTSFVNFSHDFISASKPSTSPITSPHSHTSSSLNNHQQYIPDSFHNLYAIPSPQTVSQSTTPSSRRAAVSSADINSLINNAITEFHAEKPDLKPRLGAVAKPSQFQNVLNPVYLLDNPPVPSPIQFNEDGIRSSHRVSHPEEAWKLTYFPNVQNPINTSFSASFYRELSQEQQNLYRKSLFYRHVDYLRHSKPTNAINDDHSCNSPIQSTQQSETELYLSFVDHQQTRLLAKAPETDHPFFHARLETQTSAFNQHNRDPLYTRLATSIEGLPHTTHLPPQPITADYTGPGGDIAALERMEQEKERQELELLAKRQQQRDRRNRKPQKEAAVHPTADVSESSTVLPEQLVTTTIAQQEEPQEHHEQPIPLQDPQEQEPQPLPASPAKKAAKPEPIFPPPASSLPRLPFNMPKLIEFADELAQSHFPFSLTPSTLDDLQSPSGNRSEPTFYWPLEHNEYVAPLVPGRHLASEKCRCTQGDCLSNSCLNYSANIECGAQCPRGKLCKNHRLRTASSKHGAHQLESRLELRRTGARGFGLFAKEFIPAGSLIIEYIGEVISDAEMNERISEYATLNSVNFYILTLKRGFNIDAGRKGNIARFINHSCDPSCSSERWSIPGSNPEREGIFSKYHLPPGTEITFDYLMEAASGSAPLACLCGTQRCSGFLSSRARPRVTVEEVRQMQWGLYFQWFRRVYDKLCIFIAACEGHFWTLLQNDTDQDMNDDDAGAKSGDNASPQPQLNTKQLEQIHQGLLQPLDLTSTARQGTSELSCQYHRAITYAMALETVFPVLDAAQDRLSRSEQQRINQFQSAQANSVANRN